MSTVNSNLSISLCIIKYPFVLIIKPFSLLQKGYLVNEEVRTLVVSFLEQLVNYHNLFVTCSLNLFVYSSILPSPYLPSSFSLSIYLPHSPYLPPYLSSSLSLSTYLPSFLTLPIYLPPSLSIPTFLPSFPTLPLPTYLPSSTTFRYYTIYDSESRDKLLEAYSDGVSLSD